MQWENPKNLDEYIGQEKAKQIVNVLADSAFKEKRQIQNILISGEYGLGKSTLARLVLNKHKTRFREHNASAFLYYKTVKVFKAHGVFLIDEIHNLPSQVTDLMHESMDSKETSIIGITTNPGKLTAPFRSRFYLVTLDPYSVDDLTQIVKNVVKRRKGFILEQGVAEEIAKRSRQTARTAVQNISFMFDLATIQNVKRISSDLITEGFNKLRIDEKGLTDIDYRYLDSLPDDRPVGIQYISAKIGVDPETIEQEIEPFLMRQGYVDRTNKGRFKLGVETTNTTDPFAQFFEMAKSMNIEVAEE